MYFSRVWMDLLRTKTYVLDMAMGGDTAGYSQYQLQYGMYGINKPHVVCNASSNLLPAYGTDFSADSRYIVIEVRMAV